MSIWYRHRTLGLTSERKWYGSPELELVGDTGGRSGFLSMKVSPLWQSLEDDDVEYAGFRYEGRVETCHCVGRQNSNMGLCFLGVAQTTDICCTVHSMYDDRGGGPYRLPGIFVRQLSSP
jgi:hypothetical protein